MLQKTIKSVAIVESEIDTTPTKQLVLLNILFVLRKVVVSAHPLLGLGRTVPTDEVGQAHVPRLVPSSLVSAHKRDSKKRQGRREKREWK
jgi:hypothetical protein